MEFLREAVKVAVTVLVRLVEGHPFLRSAVSVKITGDSILACSQAALSPNVSAVTKTLRLGERGAGSEKAATYLKSCVRRTHPLS